MKNENKLRKKYHHLYKNFFWSLNTSKTAILGEEIDFSKRPVLKNGTN